MLIRVGGHQVEDVADRLKRGGQDVEGHLVEARGVGLPGEAEAFLHRRDRHPVDVVDRDGVRQVVQGLPAQVAVRRVSGWREVVEILVVAGDPQIGRRDGTELDNRVEVVVRDPVNLGGGACLRWIGVSGHRWNLSLATSGRQCDRSRWMRT